VRSCLFLIMIRIEKKRGAQKNLEENELLLKQASVEKILLKTSLRASRPGGKKRDKSIALTRELVFARQGPERLVVYGGNGKSGGYEMERRAITRENGECPFEAVGRSCGEKTREEGGTTGPEDVPSWPPKPRKKEDWRA